MSQTPSPLPPSLADRFEVRRVLGEGMGGVVLLARDRELERDVAIKILKARDGDGRKFRARFRDEARVAAGLRHPGLVPLLAFGDEPGEPPYIVSEYVPGATLRDHLRREGRVAPARAFAWIREAGAALAHLHDHGVLHRDVKPENTLVGEDGAARLIDLGLLKELDAARGRTTTGVLVGTPRYLAPEVWRGGEAGPAADQFALAAVLYELLLGEPVIDDRLLGEISAGRFADRPLPLEALGGAREERHGAALARALAVAPSSRYPGVPDFLDDLGPPPAEVLGLSGEATAIRPDLPRRGVPEAAPRPGSSPPAGPWPRLAAVLAFGALLALAARGPGPPPAPRPVEVAAASATAPAAKAEAPPFLVLRQRTKRLVRELLAAHRGPVAAAPGDAAHRAANAHLARSDATRARWGELLADGVRWLDAWYAAGSPEGERAPFTRRLVGVAGHVLEDVRGGLLGTAPLDATRLGTWRPWEERGEEFRGRLRAAPWGDRPLAVLTRARFGALLRSPDLADDLAALTGALRALPAGPGRAWATRVHLALLGDATVAARLPCAERRAAFAGARTALEDSREGADAKELAVLLRTYEALAPALDAACP